jgi:hypothetical protein
MARNVMAVEVDELIALRDRYQRFNSAALADQELARSVMGELFERVSTLRQYALRIDDGCRI